MIVVVTGCDGLVGAACVRGLSRRGHAIVALSHSTLDIEDRAMVDVLMKARQAQAVVCAAARSHVEGCEREPAETRRIKVDATVALARTANTLGAAFVAFSSEYSTSTSDRCGCSWTAVVDPPLQRSRNRSRTRRRAGS
jgi:dTDP-4-dehydrorhamnose reductase